MAAKNDAVAVGVRFHRALQHQAKFKTGPLPRKPDDLVLEAAVEFFQLRVFVFAGSDGDGPVGVQVVNVLERKEGMKWSVDGRRRATGAEGTEWVVGDHLIFKLLAAIHVFELVELIHVEQRKTRCLYAAEISTAPFHRQNRCG